MRVLLYKTLSRGFEFSPLGFAHEAVSDFCVFRKILVSFRDYDRSEVCLP